MLGADVVDEGRPPAPAGLMPALLRSFSYREYRLLWFHSVLLHLGRQTWEVIQGWLLLQLTSSAAVLGVANALWRLPTFVVEPVGGVLADRVDRRLLMALTMLPYVPLLAIMGIGAQAGWIAPWHAFAAALVGGVCSALYRPSRQALLPNLVPREALVNAVALGGAVQYVGMAVGPALAGLLIASAGIAAAFYGNALIYGAGVLLLALVHLPRITGSAGSLWHAFTAGLRYVGQDRTILVLVGLQLFIDIPAQSYATLMPVLARDEFHAGAEGLGLLLALSAVGSAAGIAVVAGLGPSRPRAAMLLGSGFGYCCAILLLSSLPDLGPALGAMVAAGAAYGLYTTLTNALIQWLVDDAYRGRVMSTVATGHMGAAFAGNLLMGAAASAVGVRTAMAAVAVVAAGATLAVALAVPSLRRS